jgi:hypothetical protein
LCKGGVLLKIIKRVLNFDKDDWKHCHWLFRSMVKKFFILEFNDAYESWLFLKLHLTHDSKKLK